MDSTRFGYCCNVHPGKTLDEVRHGLTEHALKVKSLTSPDASSYVGLWLSATTAKQLSDSTTCLEFRDWLSAAGLVPYTLNGFPYGDFHQSVVKHQVYQPSWAEESRLDYTLQLASILDNLLPKGVPGTISTLPLGWSASNGSNEQDFFRRCAQNLQGLAHELAELRSRTGRLIVVCIEPEPGCVLDSADDIINFFSNHLGNDPCLRSHIGVCHDICHSAVMYEQQAQAINAYRQANVLIGKVQVSSAVSIDFEQLTISERELAFSQLEQFAEPRYLHQTVWKSASHNIFFEDLPLAISQIRRSGLQGEVRVHFHVPIFADQMGLLSTTQGEISECVKALRKPSGDNPFPHFEVETYAWDVLPFSWRPSSLAKGIAQELGWLKSLLVD